MNKIFLFLSLLLISLGACKIKDEKQPDHVVSNNWVNDLPHLMLTTQGKSPISARELEGKTILFFFQPDCDHCQREAKEIREHLSAFDAYKIYFITTATFGEINQFAHDYDLAGKANIYFAQTTLDAILNSVGPISAPSTFIYSDQKLVKHLDGEIPINEIVKHL